MIAWPLAGDPGKCLLCLFVMCLFVLFVCGGMYGSRKRVGGSVGGVEQMEDVHVIARPLASDPGKCLLCVFVMYVFVLFVCGGQGREWVVAALVLSKWKMCVSARRW